MAVKKVYLLDFGQLLTEMGCYLPGFVSAHAHLENKYPGGKVDIAVSGVVLEHSAGRVLFDTGFNPALGKTGMARFSDENGIENQLKIIGLKPSDISFVVFSHLHFDHVGQVQPFLDQRTPLVVSKRELEFALYMTWLVKNQGYNEEDMLPLRNAAWFPIDRNIFELFDGVELSLTGGHTPGHMIMNAKTDAGNEYIFTGDFLHIPEQLDIENGGWFLGDKENFITYLREMKLKSLAKKTKIVIGHDPGLWTKYPRAKPID